jgi:hypothetical protein
VRLKQTMCVLCAFGFLSTSFSLAMAETGGSGSKNTSAPKANKVPTKSADQSAIFDRWGNLKNSQSRKIGYKGTVTLLK